VNIKDAILATIANEEGKALHGRTLLQKKLYFLSVLLNEDFDFRPHYFGPYSPTVADDLGALTAAGFISEDVDIFPGSAGPFGERRRYSYKLDPSCEEILPEIADELQACYCALERINSHPIAGNSQLLPVAAKVHFIMNERGRASVEEIRQRATELGWNLGERDIDQVVEYLEHLGLVKGA